MKKLAAEEVMGRVDWAIVNGYLRVPIQLESELPDAFIHSGLERWLRVRDVSRLVIAGISTNNSVEASARTAGNLGFDTQVVADATFAFAKTDYASIPRSADEAHAMSLANLDGQYATITRTQHLLDTFCGPSD